MLQVINVIAASLDIIRQTMKKAVCPVNVIVAVHWTTIAILLLDSVPADQASVEGHAQCLLMEPFFLQLTICS